jgi:hypothetical protein
MGLYTGSGIFSGTSNSGKNGGIIQTAYASVPQVVSANGDGIHLNMFDVAITPASSSSRFLIIVSLGCVSSNTSNSLTFEIRRNGSSINDMRGNSDGSRPRRTFRTGRNWNSDYNHGFGISFTAQDFPNTTSTVTYNLYSHPQNNNRCFINRTEQDSNGSNNYQARTHSSMTVMEIGDT